MKRCPCLIACTLVSFWGSPLWAQDAIFAQPGSRVRLTTAVPTATPGDPTVSLAEERRVLIGALVTADDESLTLRLDRTERPLRVPRLSIRTLEVSMGKRSAWKKGAMVGAALGAVLIYLDDPCIGPDSHCPLNSHVGERLGGAAAGALAYGLVGMGIGSLFKTDRWHPLALHAIRVSLAPTRGRGMGLSLCVSF